jgi:hypothetical protein
MYNLSMNDINKKVEEFGFDTISICFKFREDRTPINIAITEMYKATNGYDGNKIDVITNFDNTVDVVIPSMTYFKYEDKIDSIHKDCVTDFDSWYKEKNKD